ncbi:cytochrome P450 [Paenibacillus sp. GD4]|uniref:cytochrome P450 n=1 Tax=Paenibacillus TaxID=44249 RepID=UPI0025432A8F|nr:MULTISPECIES: cytochrome P450 [Paenibacillus]MDQ1914731.1 cytochrome P450 [Paenibacillus sp. GD4]
MNPTKYANNLSMPELDTLEKRLNPFELLSKLRKETPVRYDPVRSCWDVFTYEEVHRILKDAATFSSVRSNAGGQNLLFMDPPKHTQMRDLVNKAFTPRVIEGLAPRIRSVTEELLAAITGEEMDVVAELATPLPVIVIAELLGVPSKDRQLFKRWSDSLVESAEGVSDEAFQRLNEKRIQVVMELSQYFKGILEQRSQQLQDDLISALLQAEIEGERLSERELIHFCILLLAAGNETTTNLITNGVRLLAERPELQTELENNLELIPGFVEEVLRFYPPIVAIGRVAAKDTMIGGHTIKAGEQVISWVGAANRDEAKFTAAEQFNLHRKPNPHISFGFGIHFCLGAPLARLEGRIAFELLLRHIRDIRQIPGKPTPPIPSSFVFGMKQYPISFQRS